MVELINTSITRIAVYFKWGSLELGSFCSSYEGVRGEWVDSVFSGWMWNLLVDMFTETEHACYMHRHVNKHVELHVHIQV